MFVKEEKRHIERRQPCDNGGEEWSDTSISQGTPKGTSKQQRLEEEGNILLYRLQREPGPMDQQHDFRISASRTMT